MLLVRNRNFRLFWSAAAVSNLGDGVSALAFPWLTSLLTRDPVLIGAVAAAGRLPWLLFAIPAGVVTDAADRRRLIVGADLVRLVLTLGIVALALSLPALPAGADAAGAAGPVAALAAIAFCLGAAEVLRDNAAQSALPSLVPHGDLEAANGQLWTAEEVMGRFVGPPLAGLLIALAVPVPFLADAATFALAAALVSAVALAPRPAPRANRGFLARMGEGMLWLWRHPALLYLAVFLGVVNFLSAGTLALLVLVGQEILGLSPAGYGLLLTCGAVGGVLGGLAGPALARRCGARACVVGALLAMLAEPAAVAFGASAPGVAAGLATSAFGGMVWNIVTVSWRQRMIPDALLGRVNSLYRFFAWGGIPLGALAAGAMGAWLAPELGRTEALRAPYLLATAAFAGLALLAWPTLRFRAPRP
ncbi:MFS transporter [Oceaniglobus roseus]|uniref:MFS transporter n=1 Tax=Oceaniglobus roseus TaxID=1737570 RepID=UPI000C7E8E4A|nr:MFS transporter [Kandeliimicrobium roseum]